MKLLDLAPVSYSFLLMVLNLEKQMVFLHPEALSTMATRTRISPALVVAGPLGARHSQLLDRVELVYSLAIPCPPSLPNVSSPLCLHLAPVLALEQSR